MNIKGKRRLSIISGIMALALAVLACSLPGSSSATLSTPTATLAATSASQATDTPTFTLEAPAPDSAATASEPPVSTDTPTSTPIVHTLMPGEPPAAYLSNITDPNSSALASEHRANGGDYFNANLYERPFSSSSMDYAPDLDITDTSLSTDGTWVYVNILLAGQAPSGGLTGDYGLELDLNRDGRGDVLVLAARPGSAWSTDGVKVWTDTNHDVGAAHPIKSDPPGNTDGYDKLVFDQGAGADPDLAWARTSPTDPGSAQVAFKTSLLNGSDKYLWGAWAMGDGTLDPAWFDFNDHFTLAQAGSPLVEDSANYPLKALALVDNTCRWVVGFKPTGTEPGICPVPPTPTPKPTKTPSPTPTLMVPGSVSGTIYDNGTNQTLKYNSSYSKPAGGITVSAYYGDCSAPGSLYGTFLTDKTGKYNFVLNPGVYCISFASPSAHQTGPKTINVPNGTDIKNVNFFYYIYLI